ncbi:MAG TPA: chemotaxis protein CheW, partial [Polyangiaceae bacterium]|nr:chemotaxis protein CheW [Polyangiaceae bacterium]
GRGEPVQAPSDELLATLDSLGLEAAQISVVDPPPLDLEAPLLEKLEPFELELLREGVAQGRRALRAEFRPTPELVARGQSINSVRERVAEVAEIVKVLPRSVPAGPDAPGGLAFVLLLLTQASNEVVAQAAGIDPTAVTSLVQPGPDAETSAPVPLEALETPDVTDSGFDTQPRRGVVRVDVSRLDAAMTGLSALIVTRYRLERAMAALARRGADTREMAAILTDNARQLRDLRASIVRVRMVPIRDLLDRVPLLVRGLRRTTQRAVRLELEGGDAELDKAVSERLFPVIVHLVRNAVDHAIETPEERLRRGKPEEGLLRIACGARSNTRLELTVTDDGRGIDGVAVARKAGKPAPRDSAELLDLLCLPGFSTRELVTTTSGRGMGMEIVKRAVVDDLGGEIELETTLGQGTTFRLRVPLTISIIDAFSFECAGERFVVPVAMVEEILEVDPKALVHLPAGYDDQRPPLDVIARRGSPIPLVGLARLFRFEAGAPAKAIVVRRGGAPLAFGVDRMLGQQEVVVRPLNDPLIRLPGISGATDLGDGRLTLVLDLVALGAKAGGGRVRESYA